MEESWELRAGSQAGGGNPDTMPSRALERLAEEYRDCAARGRAGDHLYRHRGHDRLHRAHRRLSASPEGRETIRGLVEDPDRCVGLGAASHSHQGFPTEARSLLLDLVDAGGPGSFEAEWNLIEFDPARLHFDD